MGTVQTICLNSVVRRKNNQFVQDHTTTTRIYNLVYIKCAFTEYTLLGAYIMLIKISETLTSRSSKITGRFSLALTRDILEGYTSLVYTHSVILVI